MDHIPSVELLEATHDFPGPYTFKVIGHASDGFVERVVAAVRDELQSPDDPPYEVRHTPRGRQVSVTLNPHIELAAQIQAVYRRVALIDGLIMLL